MTTQNPSMNAKFLRSYRNGKGTIVFVYTLLASELILKKYEEIQGDNFRKDEETGKSLFFTINYGGDDMKVIITPKDKVVADMSEYQKAASLAAQFGGNFGSALASAAANKLLGGNNPMAQPVTPMPVISAAGPEDL